MRYGHFVQNPAHERDHLVFAPPALTENRVPLLVFAKSLFPDSLRAFSSAMELDDAYRGALTPSACAALEQILRYDYYPEIWVKPFGHCMSELTMYEVLLSNGTSSQMLFPYPYASYAEKMISYHQGMWMSEPRARRG